MEKGGYEKESDHPNSLVSVLSGGPGRPGGTWTAKYVSAF